MFVVFFSPLDTCHLPQPDCQFAVKIAESGSQVCGGVESRIINSIVSSAVIAFLSTFVLFMKYHTRTR